MKELLIVILFASAIISCNKLDIEKGTPKCVKNKIEDFNKSSTCNNAKVNEYTFQGNTVYTFDLGTCVADMATEVIRSDCKSPGFLGGISGSTKIKGTKFSTVAFIQTTWKK